MAENKPILGELLKGGEERDAIHIAILPATAGDYISPGARINVRPDGWADLQGDPNAIADPFLPGQIYPGQQFYALLFPYTIESLRHEWVHRDFPRTIKDKDPRLSDSQQDSLNWLLNFAEEWGFNFEDLIEEASSEDSDRWVTAIGRDIHSRYELEGDYDLFWHHLEVYTGKHFSPDHRESLGWSCSC